MDAQRTRENLKRLGETDKLTPVALWVYAGATGRVMCLDCRIKAEGRDKIGHCEGCPKAWRETKSGAVEFWEEPEGRRAQAN